jgi:hypothetical protein
MWYESAMLSETLDSIQQAIEFSQNEDNIELELCLNSQTYLEQPIEGEASDMFDLFMNHPLISKCKIFYKNDNDDFYNVGDLRREKYKPEYKYTVWGESDCLVPYDYFRLLSEINIEHPHILTLSSRKMWDDTWKPVEHENFKSYDSCHKESNLRTVDIPFNYFDYISCEELNTFNESCGTAKIIRLEKLKVDGSLLTLSGGLPNPFISPKQKFVAEDTACAIFLNINDIPQYHISNKLKGHNYNHPNKRLNTLATREDDLFKELSFKSIREAKKFILEETKKHEKNLSSYSPL